MIGLGIDLIEIARMEGLLARKGARALRRLFTADEVAYASQRSEPARHFAVRVAAKEAAFKALAGSVAASGIGWRELEVAADHHGRPLLLLHGAAEARAAVLGVRRCWVSLSHSETTAAAVVVLE